MYLEVLTGNFSAQNDTHIYIATERIVPLTWHLRRKSLSEETIKWGLYSIAVGCGVQYEVVHWLRDVRRKRSASSIRKLRRCMAQYEHRLSTRARVASGS